MSRNHVIIIFGSIVVVGSVTLGVWIGSQHQESTPSITESRSEPRFEPSVGNGNTDVPSLEHVQARFRAHQIIQKEQIRERTTSFGRSHNTNVPNTGIRTKNDPSYKDHTPRQYDVL